MRKHLMIAAAALTLGAASMAGSPASASALGIAATANAVNQAVSENVIDVRSRRHVRRHWGHRHRWHRGHRHRFHYGGAWAWGLPFVAAPFVYPRPYYSRCWVRDRWGRLHNRCY